MAKTRTRSKEPTRHVITRTIIMHSEAFVYAPNEDAVPTQLINEDGTPAKVVVDRDLRGTDLTDAKKLYGRSDIVLIPDKKARVEELRAMSLEDFIAHSYKVEEKEES